MSHEHLGLAVAALLLTGAFVALGALAFVPTLAPELVTDAVGVPVAVGAGTLFVGAARPGTDRSRAVRFCPPTPTPEP